jgi:hypothetical protein
MAQRSRSSFQMLVVQLVVSVGALAVFLAHVLWPGFTLDVVAVALLGLAVLPWLGSLVESFELFGAKVRYRELKAEVGEVKENLQRARASLGAVDSRLDRVESFLFSGAGTAEQQGVLSEALSAYRVYLAEVGVEPGPVLRIHIDEQSPATSYPDEKAGRFVLGSALADQPDSLLHEYTHYLVAKLAREPRERWERGIAGVESGIAYYLPSSAQGNHVHAGMYDLTAPPGPEVFAPNEAHLDGLRWASAFWELRNQYGQIAVDRSILHSWRAVWGRGKADGRAFVRQLRETSPVQAEVLDRVLEDHGVAAYGETQ